MPLESLRPDARPKITRMSVETPKNDQRVFDLENEYTDEEWEKNRAWLRNEINTKPKPPVGNLAALKILSKREFDKLDITPEEWEKLKKYAKNEASVDRVAFFKTLDPDFDLKDYPNAEKKLDEYHWDDWDDLIFKDDDEWFGAINNLFCLKILKPNKFQQLDREKIFSKLIPSPFSDSLPITIGFLKFIFPEEKKAIDQLGFNFNETKKTQLAKGRIDFGTWLDIAMAIADDFEVSDNGIKIIFNKPNNPEEIPPTPNSRKF